MVKLLRLAGLFLAGLLLVQCSDNPEAEKPVYIRIDEFPVQTDYDLEGSAHSAISTAWVFVNNQVLGTFELPCVIPAILPEGEVDFTIYPGINTNGISSLRSIYDGLRPIRITKTKPQSDDLDTLVFTAQEMVTGYCNSCSVNILEDFDQSGTNFSPTVFSDTDFVKIDDPDSLFIFTPPFSAQPEKNENVGLLTLTNERNIAELVTVNSYNIPPGTQNLYLEVTYRTNMQVSFGLQADYAQQSERDITATVLPKNEWNKIYINLITEFQAFPGANGYRVLIFARKPANLKEGRIFLDNIKLVYQE